MSSHHSQRWFNLHHNQVNAGRERRGQRQWERHENYMATRGEARREYGFMLCCGFICFAYIMFAIPAYLGYVL